MSINENHRRLFCSKTVRPAHSSFNMSFIFSNAHILNDLQYIHEFAILLKCNIIYQFAFYFIVLFSVTIHILAYVGIYFGHTQLSISSSVTLIFRQRTCNVCRFPPFLIKGSRTVYKALHNSNSNIRLGGLMLNDTVFIRGVEG